MAISRRQLVTGTAAGVGLAFAGTVPIGTIANAGSVPPQSPRPSARPFPPLVDDPDGLLALPEGFTYQVVSRSGETDLDGGTGKTPGRMDGSAAFPADGNRIRLIQNHELWGRDSEFAVPHVDGTVYDPAAEVGGCTVVELDDAGQRVSEWVGISGTSGNCAGGQTPWGTWMTCEETEERAGDVREAEGAEPVTWTKDHGYVFEVFPDTAEKQIPEPIKAFGRFAHEAVVIEPSLARAYLTEDASDPSGLFYRWSAPDGVTLAAGVARAIEPTAGVLAAMKVVLDDGSVLPDLAYITSAQLGRPFSVEWTEVPDRDAQTTPTRTQLVAGTDVTAGKKLEGAWGDEHGVYFCSSYAFAEGELPVDATKHNGQVWYYHYADETVTLTTYFPHLASTESEDHAAKYPDLYFDGPDNVTVTQWGTLILAEDGVGASHVLSSVPGGPTYAIARTQLQVDGEFSEFTGPTFSPDGSILFVNLQSPGITFAISGPWADHLG